MKASSSCNFPRARNSSASTRKMPSSLPSRTIAGSGDGRSGTADILGEFAPLRPVPKTHKIPFSTARVSCHGRPRPSVRRRGHKIGSISSH
jgi:hypothetical protein